MDILIKNSYVFRKYEVGITFLLLLLAVAIFVTVMYLAIKGTVNIVYYILDRRKANRMLVHLKLHSEMTCDSCHTNFYGNAYNALVIPIDVEVKGKAVGGVIIKRYCNDCIEEGILDDLSN